MIKFKYRIKTNCIYSITIPDAMREITRFFGIRGDKAEAIAAHIVHYDTDWIGDLSPDDFDVNVTDAVKNSLKIIQ